MHRLNQAKVPGRLMGQGVQREDLGQGLQAVPAFVCTLWMMIGCEGYLPAPRVKIALR